MGCSCSKGALSRAAVSPAPPDAEPSPAPPGGLQRAPTRRRGSVSAESGIARTLQQLPSMGGGAAKAAATRERLQEVVASTLLFKGLDEEQRACVVDAMFERRVAAGETFIREGEEGDNFYVVEQGSFEASVGGARVASYEGRGSFGELALMYNCPRAATVTALTDGALWAVDRATFRALVVHSMAERQQRYEASLRGMPIFRHLGQEQLAAIADCLQAEEFRAGEHILREGEALDEAAKFFVLEAGEVDCRRTFEGEKRAVGRLGPGDVFGEVALLTKAPRQADCVAATPVKCLTMSRDAFERVMGPVEQVLAAQIAQYAASNAQYAAGTGGSASDSPAAAAANTAAAAEPQQSGSPRSPSKIATAGGSPGSAGVAALLPGSPRPSPSLSGDGGAGGLGRRRSARSARSTASSEGGDGHLGGGGSPAAAALAAGGDADPAAATAQEGEPEPLPPIAEEPSDGAAAGTPRAAKPGSGGAKRAPRAAAGSRAAAAAGKAPGTGKQASGGKKGGAAAAAGKRGKA